MIPCQLSHLETRCRERGYTLDHARPCIVSREGNSIMVDETHPAYPRPRPGLGDYIAAGLAWLGITKPRVEAFFGGPCGCGERQEALNAWGRETLGIGRPDAPSGSD